MDDDEYDITGFFADNTIGSDLGANPGMSDMLDDELHTLHEISKDCKQRQIEECQFEELMREDINGSPLFTFAKTTQGTTTINNILKRKTRKLELCPICGKVGMSNIGAGTKNKNGGTGSKYRKHCQACGNIFLMNNKHEIERRIQIWRDENPDCEDKDIPKEVITQAYDITYAQVGVRSLYLCSICGKPKRYCMHGKANKKHQTLPNYDDECIFDGKETLQSYQHDSKQIELKDTGGLNEISLNKDDESTVNDICKKNAFQTTSHKEVLSDSDSEDDVPLSKRQRMQNVKDVDFSCRQPCIFDHRKRTNIYGKYVWFWGVDDTLHCWRMVQILQKQAEQPHRYSLLLLLRDNDTKDMKEWVSDDGFFASNLDFHCCVYAATDDEIFENKRLHDKIVKSFKRISV